LQRQGGWLRAWSAASLSFSQPARRARPVVVAS